MHMKAVYCTLVLLVGCAQFAQVPKPSTYPYTLQQHMQAAHHWDVLARQVANEVAAIIRDGPLSSTEPVHVRNHDDRSPFDEAFRGFLITELIEQGVWVPLQGVNSGSVLRDNHLEINWDMQLVVHNAYRTNPLSFGLSQDVGQGTHDGPLPHSEAIITVTTTYRGTILSRNSNVFYLNDADLQQYKKDWQHYWSRPDAPQKSYVVVDR
jgi:hypothetical protein